MDSDWPGARRVVPCETREPPTLQRLPPLAPCAKRRRTQPIGREVEAVGCSLRVKSDDEAPPARKVWSIAGVPEPSCRSTEIRSIPVSSIAWATHRPSARFAADDPLAEGIVLEIGAGSGANFPHYDPARVTTLYALEPNPAMIRRRAPPEADGAERRVPRSAGRAHSARRRQRRHGREHVYARHDSGHRGGDPRPAARAAPDGRLLFTSWASRPIPPCSAGSVVSSRSIAGCSRAWSSPRHPGAARAGRLPDRADRGRLSGGVPEVGVLPWWGTARPAAGHSKLNHS
jgi:hypothetical protein